MIVPFAKRSSIISNEADISACKLGVLPYRARVRAFWHTVFIGLVGLVLVGAGFLVLQSKEGSVIGFFLALGMGGVAIYKAIQFSTFLSTPNLQSIEEEVSEKSSYSNRGMTSYHLVCNGRKFTTNSKTWESIIEGCKYRLWYSPVNNQVVASELQGYSL